jgi:hypothetical protein
MIEALVQYFGNGGARPLPLVFSGGWRLSVEVGFLFRAGDEAEISP